MMVRTYNKHTQKTPITLGIEQSVVQPLVLKKFSDTELVPARVCQLLYQFADQHHVSINKVLLAAFAIFSAKIANENDIVISTIKDEQNTTFTFNLSDTFISILNSQELRNDNNYRNVQCHLNSVSCLTQKNIDLFEYKITSSQSNINNDIKTDLNYWVAEEKLGDIIISCRFDRSIFPKHFLLTIVKRFKQFLIELITHKDSKISSLSLVFKEEYQKIRHEFNVTTTDFPKDKSLIDVFESVVACYPDHTAVTALNGQLTYQELHHRVKTLATHLLSLGIKPKDSIVIVIDNRLEMIIAVLAVLSIGAVYVPLGHDTPTERMQYIINDSGCQLILSIPELVKTINTTVQIVDIQKLPAKTGNFENRLPNHNDTACIIYTSGTTGKPKGVCLNHRALVNLSQFYIKNYEIGPKTHCSKYAGFGFDASILEIFPTLLSGATLYIVPESTRKDLLALHQYIEQQRIDVAFLPTQLAELFIELPCQYLKFLITGGEKIKKYSQTSYKIINAYGTTETAVKATSFSIDKSYANIPIGKPIFNTQCFVVDAHHHLLPIGMVGELLVGGEALALGYHQMPEMTAKKFIENPFQTKEERTDDRNHRLYKTGDLVRWLPDGHLEYVGRNDFQVKIRGYRVEPEEIEGALRQIDGILQTIVVVVDGPGEEKYLCAYYTGAVIDKEVLVNELSKKLASQMIPADFIWMDQFPINTSGKIDRKNLPRPKSFQKVQIDKPGTTNEEIIICQSFASILNLKMVGRDDDFFSLGGHSIKVIALVSQLQKDFDISVADVYQYRTPEKIAFHCPLAKNSLENRLKAIQLEYAQIAPIRYSDAMLKKRSDYINDSNELFNKFSKKNMSDVLLTGATGYLGCNLLNQLLSLTDYHIFVIVRADSDFDAVKRISQKYEFYFNKSLNTYLGKRLSVIKADIEAPQLGLTSNSYHHLAQRVDSIIHCAALTKHYGDYQKFYSANVKATINLLELAKLTALKDFHYISTRSVLDVGYHSQNEGYIATEDDFGNDLLGRSNFYVQTKFEGEKIVIDYRRHGVSGHIYRVGNLALMASNGCLQENLDDNAFFNQFKCLTMLGFIPERLRMQEISPVDSTAQAIVTLFDKLELNQSIYHVFNPQLFDMVGLITQLHMKDVAVLSMPAFIDKLLVLQKSDEMRELVDRFLLYQGWLEDKKTYQSTMTVLQNRTEQILKQLHFEWPEINKNMFLQFITALIAN